MKQYHTFANLNLGTDKTSIKPVFASVPFLVKKVKFGFAYRTSSTVAPACYIVKSSITSGDVVGILNKYALDDGPDKITLDGLSESKNMSYIFRDPISINGDITFTFQDINDLATVINYSYVFVHMEFLG
jgi:hypothetical protein